MEMSPLFKTQKSDWHYLSFAQAGGQLLLYLVSRLHERTSIVLDQVRDHHQSGLRRMAICLWRRKDDLSTA
jgi:hypothetical protein